MAAARPRITTATATPTPAARAVELLGLGLLVSGVEDEVEDEVADSGVFVVVAAPDSLVVVLDALFVEEVVEEVVVVAVCEEPIMEANTASSMFHPLICSPWTSRVELTVKLAGW